jgi:hypothetical protein
MVIGHPPAEAPPRARASTRPIVFVMANIHAGEVEGKEALLHVARRMTGGDLEPLLDRAIWLFAPIYNADGNEKVSVENRPEQNGPIGGVGTRENARGFDLNRDFIKLDTAEGRALVGLLTRWDPDVVLDLHTTNGSHHGYHLTYSPSLNPNTDPRLLSYVRERLLPAVRGQMAARHQLRTYAYGNFTTTGSLNDERLSLGAGEADTGVWRTFDHRPRFGHSYVGLRNRTAILSEAYSYLDFAGRVRATEAFVEEIMRFVADNSEEIRGLHTRIDADPLPSTGGVTFDLARSPADATILVGAVEKKVNPRSGREMLAMVEAQAVPTRMREYDRFVARGTRRVPREYVVPVTAGGTDAAVAARLEQHGVGFRRVAAAGSMHVERFVLDTVTHAERPFQGHRETSVSGRWEEATVEVPAGSLVVPTGQPLGRLVFYLLEPESDDGLTRWNVLDAELRPGSTHPVMKSRD